MAPQWPELEQYFTKSGFRLLKSYPTGTQLFTIAGSNLTTLAAPWPVQLWYDPPEPDAKLSAIAPKVSYTMTFRGRAGHTDVTTLVDSGACTVGTADGYISQKAATQMGLRATSSPTPAVTLADGTRKALGGVVQTRLQMGAYHGTVHLLVLPDTVTGAQIILGTDWLNRHGALMDWESHTLTLRRGHKRVALRPAYTESPDMLAGSVYADPMQVMDYVRALLHDASTPRNLISKNEFARCVTTYGEHAFLAVVRWPDPTDEAWTPTCALAAATLPTLGDTGLIPAHDLQNLLTEHADVFEELKGIRKDTTGISHTIPLVEGAHPPSKRMYRLSQGETTEVNKQVADLLAKGFIEPSNSPFGAPVLFVQKKDGTLRMCLDFRALNKLTVKRNYPMPNIQDLFDQLEGAKVFSSLDLQSGYYQIPITKEDQEKTAFITPKGQYQFKVLCFGLTNAPASFQATMSKIFKKQLGKTVLVYLDDILVFSKTPEEHLAHLREVLGVLREHEFKAKLPKCDFNKSELKFLGHIVGRHGVRVDEDKVKVVKDWATPTNLKQLRSFLGLANYFRRFIQGYSSLVAPLMALTGTKVPFVWTPECQAAFEGVKVALTSAPVLALPRFDLPFEVWSDASIYGTGAVLLQDGKPVAYTSAKFSSAEHNYTTTDQECLGVIHALTEWRCYLDGASHVTLVTDHQPLTYLQDQKSSNLLSRRQARWMEFLSRFSFTWEYRPGRINVADPISRIWEPMCAALTRSEISSDLLDRIRKGYSGDSLFSDSRASASLQLKTSAGLWYRDTQVVIPAADGLRELILTEFHNSPTAGHRGARRLKEAISRRYWWPRLDADCTEYVASCPDCQRNKPSNQKPAGKLQPLPIPEANWDSVSLDLITKLPTTLAGHDAIVVFVDRLSKMTHFAPTHSDVDAEELAEIFLQYVFRHHGLPINLVSDRGSVFTGRFWKELFSRLQTKLHFSTAYHPQTDGQTERMNRLLEETLRHYIGPLQDDWDKHLPLIEFAINNSQSGSTGATPFELNYGRRPRVPGDLALPSSNVPAAQNFSDAMRQRMAHAKKCLRAAQDRQRVATDSCRRDSKFDVGDDVLLSTKNIKLRIPGAAKLMPRYIGPFKIQRRIGAVAYELALPPGYKIHNVFHVSLLKAWKPGQAYNPPPAILEDNGDTYWSVESLLLHRDRKCGRKTLREFLVKWEGYGPEHNSWEPEANLRESAPLEEAIEEYLARTATKQAAREKRINTVAQRRADRKAAATQRYATRKATPPAAPTKAPRQTRGRAT